MDLKAVLKNLNPPIAELLPINSINRLAQEHNFSRQHIAGMLRGEKGNDKSIMPVLDSALKIVEDAGKEVANIRELVQLQEAA